MFVLALLLSSLMSMVGTPVAAKTLVVLPLPVDVGVLLSLVLFSRKVDSFVGRFSHAFWLVSCCRRRKIVSARERRNGSGAQT